jgi:hypothetical protein
MVELPLRQLAYIASPRMPQALAPRGFFATSATRDENSFDCCAGFS